MCATWMGNARGIRSKTSPTAPSESSFELLVKLNPDFIFVCDRDSAISRPGAGSRRT